jgi:squalene synthase HpnC
MQAMGHDTNHYENFPVASFLMPRELRHPVMLIYTFARRADDFADEGDLSGEERLALLVGYRRQLDMIAAEQPSNDEFFHELSVMIAARQLPLQPFYDLLDAFTQDVTQTRYTDFEQLLDYCRRSANPVGHLMLHLYRQATPQNIEYADAICSALQIINFLQDVAIDYRKDRIYLPQNELQRFHVPETQIANNDISGEWWALMRFQIDRARAMLHAGKPLGHILQGRIGLEMRTIIAGGETILDKLTACRGDIFQHRPTLNAWNWISMLYRALSKQ